MPDGCYRGCRLLTSDGVVEKTLLRYLLHRGDPQNQASEVPPCAPNNALMAAEATFAMCILWWCTDADIVADCRMGAYCCTRQVGCVSGWVGGWLGWGEWLEVGIGQGTRYMGCNTASTTEVLCVSEKTWEANATHTEYCFALITTHLL